MWSRLYNSRLSARRSSGNADRSVLLVGPAYLNNAFTTTNANGTRRNASGLIESVAANTPRFDYDVNGTLLGLLVEESRTNLLTHSEDFGNVAWTKSNATIEADATISPSGGTADKIVESAATAIHQVLGSLLTKAASALSYAGSFYAKPDGRNTIVLLLSDGSGNGAKAEFNVSTGVVVNSTTEGSGFSVDGATITPDVDGFYRCAVRGTSSAVTGIRLVARLSNGTESYAGDGVSGVYIWGAQLEAGSFATSYIPTTTAAVTRSADDIVCTDLAAIGYNASEGTVYLDSRTAPGISSDQVAYAFSDATFNEIIYAIRAVSTSSFNTNVRDGGVAQATSIGGVVSASTSAKLAQTFKANDFATVLNGGTPETDASGTLPTVSELRVGRLLGSNYWNGHIATLRLYPTRLPNAQLQSMTA